MSNISCSTKNLSFWNSSKAKKEKEENKKKSVVKKIRRKNGKKIWIELKNERIMIWAGQKKKEDQIVFCMVCRVVNPIVYESLMRHNQWASITPTKSNRFWRRKLLFCFCLSVCSCVCVCVCVYAFDVWPEYDCVTLLVSAFLSPFSPSLSLSLSLTVALSVFLLSCWRIYSVFYLRKYPLSLFIRAPFTFHPKAHRLPFL